MDKSNFRFCSLRHQKLKNHPTYQSTSGCAEPKIAARPTQAPGQPTLAEYEIFLQHFPIIFIICQNLRKNERATFPSRPRMKVELTHENGKT